jgi:hypothetical protein
MRAEEKVEGVGRVSPFEGWTVERWERETAQPAKMLPERTFVLEPQSPRVYRKPVEPEVSDRELYIRTMSHSIARAEALAALRDLARHKDPEAAHWTAEMLLLQLLNDPEIAAAFYDVPKWYA